MSEFCDDIHGLGKAIGSATRYRILEALMKGPKSVTEIVRAVRISQPAVSQHLKVLKSAGLVRDERVGQEVRYAIDLAHTLNVLRRFTKLIHRSKC
ncbi:MAG TPA: metalloregulator ArsR/SmtB family transcription factor [Candidatus Paceibacterota bacterium]|nr:metalloregulator ArsR/SmtB family transcription factor [Candidatus Paceibacterota bacterium]